MARDIQIVYLKYNKSVQIMITLVGLLVSFGRLITILSSVHSASCCCITLRENIISGGSIICIRRLISYTSCMLVLLITTHL